MYARVATGQIVTGKTDEATRILRDSILPITRQQKGFRGVYVLADRNTGKIISITLWDAEADVPELAPVSYLPESTRQKFAPLWAAPPSYARYEVTVQA
jgi:heme-degrading monooxygenase HmoA